MSATIEFLMTTLQIEKIPGGKISGPFDGISKEDISGQRLMVTIEYICPLNMDCVSNEDLLTVFTENNKIVSVVK